jgi:predicted CoA-binding protein
VAHLPELVADFLAGRRIAVAGVSRGSGSAANPVYRKLRDCGYEVFPVNPNTSNVEGVACYPDLASIPGNLDGVVVATHPDVSAAVVRQAAERKIPRVWLHRSFGQGSVSAAAIRECEKSGMACIIGGCPLMYREPVDIGHRCFRAVLGWLGRLPR